RGAERGEGGGLSGESVAGPSSLQCGVARAAEVPLGNRRREEAGRRCSLPGTSRMLPRAEATGLAPAISSSRASKVPTLEIPGLRGQQRQTECAEPKRKQNRGSQRDRARSRYARREVGELGAPRNGQQRHLEARAPKA